MNENIASIRSNLECSGDENDITTIQLINNNEEVFKLELTGNTKEFTVPSIEQGEYILRISKRNHVTREYSITADNLNNEITDYELLCADVNKDGKVNGKDWNRLYEHINETDLLW